MVNNESSISINNMKMANAWAFYDWANSVYSLVITTAIFPLYYGSIMKDESVINFFAQQFSINEFYSYSICLSFILIVFLSPILSAVADNIGNKKKFMKLFCTIGSIACAMLFFFTSVETLYIGIIFSILASVGFWGSIVFYNAYLPEIVTQDRQDALSAKGFSMGYIGSAILLIICLVLIMGIGVWTTRYSFLLVGIWWFGFAQYTFKHLPNSFTKSKIEKETLNVFYIYKKLLLVGKSLLKMPNINFFLVAFFCLSIGVQTIIYTANIFGSEELGLSSDKLIITILIIQFVAVLGAYLFSKTASILGNIKAMQLGVVIWGGLTIIAFLLDKNNPNISLQFYALAVVLGLVLGGVQSLSRSTYAKLIPNTNDNTTYFSLYDITEKIALIFGTFIYGFLIRITGGMRYSILSLGLFFIIAFIFLFFVRIKPSPNRGQR